MPAGYAEARNIVFPYQAIPVGLYRMKILSERSQYDERDH